MPKTKYLTAEQLYIEPWEREALIKTMGDLSGLRRVKNHGSADDHARISGTIEELRFNMDASVGRYDCGTALCIGGYMRLLKYRKEVGPGDSLTETQVGEISQYVADKIWYGRGGPLGRLFFPVGDLAPITARQGVRVIRHFLKTGDVDWERVGVGA